MDDRVREWLNDILMQVQEIQTFTNGISFDQYQSDRKTQAAVERKFEIIGEALNRISCADDGLLQRIRNYRDIISFRNILAHGYDSIDVRIVWGVIENNLEELNDDIGKILF
ncbi:MAG: HepT-like ribonuclease domain-containing protein [Kiritimatiellales bacterium]